MDFRRHLGERRYRLMVRMRRAEVEEKAAMRNSEWRRRLVVSACSGRVQISDGLLDPH